MTNHGTITTRTRGCDCDACRLAMRRYDKRRALRLLHGPIKVPALGAQRRIRALQALGWPLTAVAAELKCQPGALSALLYRERATMTADLHRRIDNIYRRLCMTLGPSVRVRTRALRDGYAPPLAWDDIDTDPTPVRIDDPGRASRADYVREEYAHLSALGVSDHVIAQQMDISMHRLKCAVGGAS